MTGRKQRPVFLADGKKERTIPFCRCGKKKVLRRLSSQTARWIGLKEERLVLLWPGFLSSTAKQLSSEQDSLEGMGRAKAGVVTLFASWRAFSGFEGILAAQ